MRLQIAKLSTVSALLLSSCQGQTNGPFLNHWNYQCDAGQIMTWLFENEKIGRYEFDGGSILRPISDAPTNTEYLRQDGVRFSVTGDAGQWNVKNQATGETTTCNRVILGESKPES